MQIDRYIENMSKWVKREYEILVRIENHLTLRASSQSFLCFNSQVVLVLHQGIFPKMIKQIHSNIPFIGHNTRPSDDSTLVNDLLQHQIQPHPATHLTNKTVFAENIINDDSLNETF